MSIGNSTEQGFTADETTQMPNEAAPDVQTTADAALDLEGSTNQLDQAYIGILYFKQDYEAAKRFKDEAEKHPQIKAILYHHDYIPPPSDPKVDEIEDFGRYCHAYIWLATSSAVDNGEMKHHRAVCHHEAIMNREKIFVPGIPKECIDIQLPKSLDAYTPLLEDTRFNERMESMIKHILTKLSQQNRNVVPNTIAENARPQVITNEQQAQSEDTRPPPYASVGGNVQQEMPHASIQPPNPTINNFYLHGSTIGFLQVGGESQNRMNSINDLKTTKQQENVKSTIIEQDLISFDNPNSSESNPDKPNGKGVRTNTETNEDIEPEINNEQTTEDTDKQA